MATSPFPGMDPYLEDPYLWEDVHLSLMGAMAELLLQQVRPKYWVAVERRIFMDLEEPDAGRGIRPDITVSRDVSRSGAASPGPRVATVEPVVLEVDLGFEARQTFLKIVRRPGREVVTVIELLSYANKKTSSEGRGMYLLKRDEVLRSDASLVELDLLRGGVRVPFRTPPPPAEYYAAVHRAGRRPRAEVYCTRLRESLPTIPVPLADGDPDAALSLRRAIDLTCDRRAWDAEIDYSKDAVPPLEGEDRAWADELLRKAGKR